MRILPILILLVILAGCKSPGPVQSSTITFPTTIEYSDE
jgi:hypothetical protein